MGIHLFSGVFFAILFSGVFFAIVVFGVLLLQFLGRAATALGEIARAQEKSAKSHQDTVYLLRELVTLLKSKEEKKP